MPRAAESAIERVGGDPCFMWASCVPAARDHGCLDALALVDVDASEREHSERHTGYCSGRSDYTVGDLTVDTSMSRYAAAVGSPSLGPTGQSPYHSPPSRGRASLQSR
jgi:hypothetical protein